MGLQPSPSDTQHKFTPSVATREKDQSGGAPLKQEKGASSQHGPRSTVHPGEPGVRSRSRLEAGMVQQIPGPRAQVVLPRTKKPQVQGQLLLYMDMCLL